MFNAVKKSMPGRITVRASTSDSRLGLVRLEGHNLIRERKEVLQTIADIYFLRHC
jgi:hypothetical protein